MHMSIEEYFKEITPSEGMLTELKKTPFTKLKSCVRRIYKFTGESGRELSASMKFMKSKDNCVQEILEFVTAGKYESGHTFDKTHVKRIPASSLEELELKLIAMGY